MAAQNGRAWEMTSHKNCSITELHSGELLHNITYYRDEEASMAAASGDPASFLLCGGISTRYKQLNFEINILVVNILST